MVATSDPGTLVALLAAAMVGFAMVSLVALRGWGSWLDLRRWELDHRAEGDISPAAARLELADLKDRVRRLEAIADGGEE